MKYISLVTLSILLTACDTAVLQEDMSQHSGSTSYWENLALKSPEEMLRAMYSENKSGGFSFSVEEYQKSFGGPFRKPGSILERQFENGNRCGLSNSYAYDRNNLTPSLYVDLGEKNGSSPGRGINTLQLSIYGYSLDVSEYRTSPSPGSIQQKGGYVDVRTDDGVSYNSAGVASNCHITVEAHQGRVYGTFRCQGLHKKVGENSHGQTPSHVTLEGTFDCDLNITLKTAA